MGASKINHKLLQFDVKEMMVNDSRIYWNLLYRFTKDKKDYLFMLPYEVDIEEPLSEDESSSISSDGLLTPKQQPEVNPSLNAGPSRFMRIPKKVDQDKLNMKSSGEIPEIEDRFGKEFLGLKRGGEESEHVGGIKTSRKLIKLKSRESRKSF